MRVIVFGVFDRFHPGHIFFLTEAKKIGDELVAVIARDEVVSRLKGHTPKQTEYERLEAVRSSGLVDEVVLSDEQEGEYKVLKDKIPHVIALGYDQDLLRQDLERAIQLNIIPPIEIRRISPFLPESTHSSLLP